MNKNRKSICFLVYSTSLTLLTCLCYSVYRFAKLACYHSQKHLFQKQPITGYGCYKLPSAIILVCTSNEMETPTLKHLRNSKGVLEVFRVDGAFDIVIKVKTDTFDLLRECINKIKNSLPKMQNIVTMLVIEHSLSHSTTISQSIGF